MTQSLTPIASALGLAASPSSSLATSSTQQQPVNAGKRRHQVIVDKSDDDYLMSPEDIFAESGIPPATQYNWKVSNQYGWRDLVVKVGHKNRVPRRAWREWLAKRSCARTA